MHRRLLGRPAREQKERKEIHRIINQGNDRQRNEKQTGANRANRGCITLPGQPPVLKTSPFPLFPLVKNRAARLHRTTRHHVRLGVLARLRCIPRPQKAVLKSRAVQTLRDCRAFMNFAERLECGHPGLLPRRRRIVSVSQKFARLDLPEGHADSGLFENSPRL